MPCGPKSRMRPKTLRLPLMIFIRVAVCHAELVSNVEGDVEYEGAVFAAAHRKADEFDTVFFDDERKAQCLLVEVDGRVDFQIFLIEVDGNMVEFLDDHIAVHGGNRDLTAQRLPAEYRIDKENIVVRPGGCSTGVAEPQPGTPQQAPLQTRLRAQFETCPH